MSARSARGALALCATLAVAGCSILRGLDDYNSGSPVGDASTGGSGGVDASTGGSAGSSGSSSGGSGASGGSAGSGGESGADAGGGCDEADLPQADYVVHSVPVDSLAINGACNDAAWQAAPPIPFDVASPTSNTAVCKLLWSTGSVSHLYGCCEVQDTKLESEFTAPDSDVFEDDSVEVLIKGDTNRSEFGPTASKVIINLRKAVYDVDYVPGLWDLSYSAAAVTGVVLHGTLDDATPDTGYSIEWRMNLEFAPKPTEPGLLGFALNDRDDGIRVHWNAFGKSVNVPADWGTVAFCPAP
ncbi:MAG: sugar-binding protein [Polyangiaceae bacterium]